MTSFDEYKKRRGNRPVRKAVEEKPLESKRLSPEEAAERRKRIFERPKTRSTTPAPVIPLRKNAARIKEPRTNVRDRTRANKPKDLYNRREETPKPTRRFDERTPTQEKKFVEHRGKSEVFGEQRKTTDERRRKKDATLPRKERDANTLKRRDFERGRKYARVPKEDAEAKPKKKRSGKPRVWDPKARKHTKPEPPKEPGTPERVQKLISAAGIAPRREAELMIEKGAVMVNGKVIKLGDKATEKDDIVVNGVRLAFPKKVYLMLNKPKGYVTTVEDKVYKQKTVMELVPSDERIYPIGRLDKDTTGLLLFTNDGDFANKLMHPRYEVQKTYIATLDKPFNAADAAIAKRGILLEEGVVTAVVKSVAPKKVSVTLHQGFNHVVKRLLKQMGYWVVELERNKVGPLTLNIPAGAYRYLTEEEIKKF